MMLRYIFVLCVFLSHGTKAQTMILSTSSDDYEVLSVFNDVRDFSIDIEIDAPLEAGTYNNPPILIVTYQVVGVLDILTPSEFPAFNLQRSISGEEFYEQGSSLNFEIVESADLSDGVQADELVEADVIFSFNANEIDTGRFHPPLFTLSADGTGQIQNSNNTPSETPLVEVGLGEEYITDLNFDLGNLTLIREPSRGGGGSVSWYLLAIGLLLLRMKTIQRQFLSKMTTKNP